MTVHKKREFQIICFAGCDWWYQNRGLFVPQIMSRLAKNHKVLFINSLGMRIPSLKSDKDAFQKIFKKLTSMLKYLKKDPCGMHVFTPLSIPLKNKFGKQINTFFLSLQLNSIKFILDINDPIYYIGSPPAWEIVRQKKRRMLIYERTDIFEEMPGADKEYITQLNNEIINVSELILYVNRKLMLEDHTDKTKGLMIGHGVDFEMFANAGLSENIPEDIQVIQKPIVGFFGDINQEWCDFDLIEYAAQKLENFSFVLIGPISSDISSLKKHNNIYFLGPKPYSEIPHYGKCFDVAIMPWNKNRWIEYCNPVKTKEYLALGKPVISVDYPELTPYHDIVYASDDYNDFVENIKRAYNDNHNNTELSDKCKERVINETWAAKVKLIEENILNKLSN